MAVLSPSHGLPEPTPQEQPPSHEGAAQGEQPAQQPTCGADLLDMLTVGAVVLDMETRQVVRMNRAARQLVQQLGADGATPERWLAVWLGARGVVAATTTTSQNTLTPARRVFDERTVDGAPLALACEVIPTAGCTQVLVQLSDITAEREQVRASERSLYQAQLYAESLEVAIEHLNEGVTIRDISGGIRAYNRSALVYASNRAEVEAGRAHGQRVEPVWDVRDMSGSPCAEVDRPSWRAMLTGQDIVGKEYVLAREDGRLVPVLINAASLRGEDGVVFGAVVAFHDITPIKEAERRKDDFISEVSHELRQPLTVIKGQGQLIQLQLRRMTRTELPAPSTLDTMRSLADGIVAQAMRLNVHVSDLLDVSRMQAGKLELRRAPTPLAEVLGAVVHNQRAVSQVHTIELEAMPSMVDGNATQLVGLWDRSRIEQILMNLMSNAIKYSPRGGTVWVRADAALHGIAADTPRPEDRVSIRGPVAHITIRDEGIGIPPAALPHLFGRFYRADNVESIQGTGLGLYICRQLARAHGGDLWAESHGANNGSTFHLVLPLRSDSTA